MSDPKVGVIGCGTMGQGIAGVCAAAGLETVLFKLTDEQKIDEVRTKFQVGLQKEAAAPKSKLSKEAHLNILANLAWSRWTDRVHNIKDCDALIECAPEKLDIKQRVFREMDVLAKYEAILASSTSSLSIMELARATRSTDRVMGFHPFNPFKAMKLVELARTTRTSAETLEKGRALALRLGKTPIVVGDTPGFIVNRLLIPYLLDAIRCYENGPASKEDIDSAVELGYGFPMGPLKLADLIGLDVLLAIAMSLYDSCQDKFQNKRFAPPELLKSLVARGMLGKKTKIGLYDYAAARGTPVVNDLVSSFIADHLLIPYFLDAIRCYKNGLASVEDIDLAMKLGCGLPEGPLEMSDEMGLGVVLARANHMYGDLKDECFAPPLLLQRLVQKQMLGSKGESKLGFYDYNTTESKRPNLKLPEILDFDKRFAW